MAREPITFKATINGKPIKSWARDFNKFFAASAKALDRAMQTYLETVAGDVRRRTYREAGLKVRTGDLIKSVGSRGSKGIFGVTLKASGDRVVVKGEIGSRLIYAAVQEQGATIDAKRGPFLSFPILAPGGGTQVVDWAQVTSVTIPARPYLQPAIDNSKAQGSLIFRAAYERAMAGVI